MKAGKAKENMLVVSTIHIKPETLEWICKDCKRSDGKLISYPKGDCGFFVYVNIDEDPDVSLAGIPEDLLAICKLAAKENCWWICLDSEGFEIDDIPQYITEWSRVL